MPDSVSLIIEGSVDEAVGRALLRTVGLRTERVLGRKGIGYIRSKVSELNRAARYVPMFVLADFMDTRFACPAGVVASWVPRRHPNMVFRLAVPEIESWLLADRQGVARFLRVPVARVPQRPEAVPDSKRALVDLARRSHSTGLARRPVPEAGSTATEGKGYTPELVGFVRDAWSVADARLRAPSLDRCIAALEDLAGRLGA